MVHKAVAMAELAWLDHTLERLSEQPLPMEVTQGNSHDSDSLRCSPAEIRVPPIFFQSSDMDLFVDLVRAETGGTGSG